MTPTLRAQYDEVAEKATARPWGYRTCYGVATIEDSKLEAIAHAVEYLNKTDAALITFCVNNMGAVLDEVARLEAEIMALKQPYRGHIHERDVTGKCFKHCIACAGVTA